MVAATDSGHLSRVWVPMFVLVLAGAEACGMQPESLDDVVRAVGGCYDGTIGPRTAAVGSSVQEVLLTSESRNDTLTDMEGQRFVERSYMVRVVGDTTLGFLTDYSRWIPLPPDSVVVHWGNGHNGDEYRLKRDSTGLHGVGRSTWDVADRPHPSPPYRVVAQRVPCGDLEEKG